MYPFNKVQQEDQSWNFELDGIQMVIEGFFIRDGRHWIRNPDKALAFFTIEGNLYGISNQANSQLTAEDLFDVIYQHYAYFNTHPFSDHFFREYGFMLENNGWQLEVTDGLAIRHHFEYRADSGWYYNNMLLKHQPHHIGDLMHLYAKKTGGTLKRIS